MQSVFNTIYQNKAWGNEGDHSGIGSEPTYNKIMQKRLSELIKRYNVKSILDVSCGACKWQRDFLRKHPFVSYHGIDIAKSALKRANTNLEGLPNVKLVKGDLRNMKLPPCDLLLCRDTLQHFSYENIHRALHNISKCKARIIVLGGYFPGNNIAIQDGSYFDFNPVLEPFSLMPDIVLSEDNTPSHPHKHLFVYIRA